jgi:hypothetical protein
MARLRSSLERLAVRAAATPFVWLQEGADIIAVDVCKQLKAVRYPMSTPEDLEQTVKEVESLGRRIVAREADVRDASALQDGPG